MGYPGGAQPAGYPAGGYRGGYPGPGYPEAAYQLPAYPGAYSGGPYRLTWVATPPTGLPVAPPSPRRPPYYGPPAYPATPRWGLPRLVWRIPTSVPGTAIRPARPAGRVVGQARAASAVLWMVAISALLAAGGEVWRYVLLVLGRGAALSADVVAVSDALVLTGGWLAIATGVLALVLTVRWVLTVREVAADLAAVVPARPDWQVLLGLLLPVVNLFVAGSVLAEVEHTALRVGPRVPRPSRLVLCWWLAWVTGEVLAVTTLLLGLRTDVQSRADGVLWHAVTDLAGGTLAVLTTLVVAGITGLLAPSSTAGPRRERVLTVSGAPAPPLRPVRPLGSVR